MVVTCEQVWQEISNYLANDIDAGLHAAMDEHFRQCKRCTSVLEGTRNVVQLYGDERLFRAPFGFSWRLHGKLAEIMPHRRGTALGWIVAVAATGLVVGSLAVADSAPQPKLLSEHAQSGQNVPANLVVLVAGHSKVFHVPGCTMIHDKAAGIRTMNAAEAVHEGYVPCVRCLGKYLTDVAQEFIQKHAWAAVVL